MAFSGGRQSILRKSGHRFCAKNDATIKRESGGTVADKSPSLSAFFAYSAACLSGSRKSGGTDSPFSQLTASSSVMED